MQQHSGQHVLSAAFLRLFAMPTVSFHMGAELCTIDLDAKSVSGEELKRAEGLANDIVMEDRPVEIRFAGLKEARSLGVRKLPAVEWEKLRLIDIRDFDLTACGGTHVSRTGQIGMILARRVEKVRQGVRVEFVCGGRALASARRDYAALSEAAAALSTHVWDVPAQVRKLLAENKASRKVRSELVRESAELQAARLLERSAEQGGLQVVAEVFPGRDLDFIRLLAQKLTGVEGKRTVALLAADQGKLVFAQSPGCVFNMGALLKEAVAEGRGRGGGTRDMAQGELAAGTSPEQVLQAAAGKLQRPAA
jgi:alanyl-tRNA synthetase